MAGLHIVQTIAGTRLDHGGTSRSVPSLCDALAELGASVQLVCGSPADPSVECNYPSTSVSVRLVPESRIHRHWGMRKRFQCAIEQSLMQSEGEGEKGGRSLLPGRPPRPTEADGARCFAQKTPAPFFTSHVMHDHGLWLSTNHAAADVARQLKIPRVVSPRGMLSDWSLSNGRLKKKIAWRLFQHHDLQSADAFHATGDQEAEDLRALGFRQPIAVIPNGVLLPDVMPERKRIDDKRRVLFLSRIHPKKGLLNLLHAWHEVSPSDEWKLVLAGPDECGHRSEVESLAKQLCVFHQLEFTGPIADAEKWRLYRNADLFVLPSFSENFGIVIAEALTAGLPVITTTSTPWQDLQLKGIGWWVEPTVQGIGQALREVLNQSHAERLEKGRRAEEWAQNRFPWPAVGRQMIDFYGYLLEIGKSSQVPPRFVV